MQIVSMKLPAEGVGFEPTRHLAASHGLANRPGEPYPAAFRVGGWGLGVGDWDWLILHVPKSPAPSPQLPAVDLMGVEPTTPTLQGSVAPSGMQARCGERTEVRGQRSGTIHFQRPDLAPLTSDLSSSDQGGS
jgi:hypothetical protein